MIPDVALLRDDELEELGLRVAMEERKPYVRAEQVARVRSLIEELKKPRFKIVKRKVKVDGEVVSKEVEEEVPLNAQAILRAEELLADLEGNRHVRGGANALEVR